MGLLEGVGGAFPPEPDDTPERNRDGPADPIAAAVACVDAALDIIGDDLEAGLADEVIEALALLRRERPAKYMTARAALRKANGDLRLGMLDSMVEANAPAGEDTVGTVECLVETVRTMGELFIGTDDVPYIALRRDGHREVWSLDSSPFREIVAAAFYAEHGRAPRAPHLTDAFATLAGQARHEGERHEVHLRVAVDPAGGYLIDVGDEAWRAIRVTAGGWQVLDESPVRFRRSKGTGALFEPTVGGTLDDFRALVNVDETDLSLLVTAVLECLRPDTAYPVIEVGGEQGSAKSTTTENIRRLIDPKNVLLRAAPKVVEDVFVGARNNHVVAYNNLSHLPASMQDALCTLSTGGGFAARKLYTDDDEAVYDAKRPVLMNGIAVLATQADLLSRVVRIECPTIAPGERLPDRIMSERLAEYGPRAFGFLLDTFAASLGRLPTITLDRPPRMMDFATLGEAVAQTLGQRPGQFAGHYRARLADGAVQSLEGSPVIEALVRHLDERGPWLDGTVGDLLADIEQLVGPGGRDSAWPKTAKGFRDVLTRSGPALRLLGITIEHGGSGRARRNVTVRREGPSSSARNTDPRNSTSPPSPPSPDASETPIRDSGDGDDSEIRTLTISPEGKECSGVTVTPRDVVDRETGIRLVEQLRESGRSVTLGASGMAVIRPDIGSGGLLGREVRQRLPDIAAALIEEADESAVDVAGGRVTL